MKYINITILISLCLCSCAKKENDLYYWRVTVYENDKKIEKRVKLNIKDDAAAEILTNILKPLFRMKNRSFTISSVSTYPIELDKQAMELPKGSVLEANETLKISNGPFTPVISEDSEFIYSFIQKDGKPSSFGRSKNIIALSQEILRVCREHTEAEILSRNNKIP